MFPREASERLCVDGCLPRHRAAKAGLSHRIPRFTRCDLRPLTFPERGRSSGFTLLELLIVIGIIALLLVLIAPAFTTIKSGTDVTSAAYTIKDTLDTARTYAKANNTYTWVGFAGAIGPQPATVQLLGKVAVAVVASKDGTNLWSANDANCPLLAPCSGRQNGNSEQYPYWRYSGVPQNDGTEFRNRPGYSAAR